MLPRPRNVCRTRERGPHLHQQKFVIELVNLNEPQ